MEVFVTTMAPRKGERKGHHLVLFHQNKEDLELKNFTLIKWFIWYTIELLSNLTRHSTLVDLVSVMESI